MGKPDALSHRADHGSGAEDNRDVTLLTPNFFAVRALEGVEVEGEERDLLRLIRRETKEAELEDADLRPTICRHPTEDRGSQSRQPSGRTSGQVEDLRTGEPQLLMAANVKVHRAVHCYLRPLLAHQGP